jgi:hypothetical protein
MRSEDFIADDGHLLDRVSDRTKRSSSTTFSSVRSCLGSGGCQREAGCAPRPKEVAMRYVRVVVLVLAVLLAGAGAVEATGPLFDPSGITAN